MTYDHKIIKIRLLMKITKKEEDELLKRIRTVLHKLQREKGLQEATILWPGIDLEPDKKTSGKG